MGQIKTNLHDVAELYRHHEKQGGEVVIIRKERIFEARERLLKMAADEDAAAHGLYLSDAGHKMHHSKADQYRDLVELLLTEED